MKYSNNSYKHFITSVSPNVPTHPAVNKHISHQYPSILRTAISTFNAALTTLSALATFDAAVPIIVGVPPPAAGWAVLVAGGAMVPVVSRATAVYKECA